jgi:hypothetical protein
MTACIFILCSCNNNKASQTFATKEEALHYADSIYASYPKVTRPAMANFSEFAADSVGFTKMTEIDWDTVIKYRDNYDKTPLLYRLRDGKPYRGFRVDVDALNLIRKIGRYKQLYIRLGKKDNQEYTFMVLPLDEKGNLIQGMRRPKGTGPNDNYDHLDPCPDNCVNGFDPPPIP